MLAEVRGQSALLIYPEDELSARLLPVASAYAAVCVVSLNGSCLSNIPRWEFDVDSKQIFQHIHSLTVERDHIKLLTKLLWKYRNAAVDKSL